MKQPAPHPATRANWFRHAMAVCLIVTAAPARSESAEPPGPAGKPNIVLIYADDLGWMDVGYQGGKRFETPHIDRLAAEGIVFTDGYAAAGNCAPSRACLMSGQYTPRHGVYAVGSTSRGPKGQMRLVAVPNTNQLAGSNITVAESLKAAGYTTAHFGKWHLGKEPGTLPSDQGFDVSEEFPASPGGDDPKSIFSITAAACKFIESNREKPFFIYLSHHAIHTAVQGRPATVKHFQEKYPGASNPDAKYLACTRDLDDGVGILLAKLADLDLAGNTLVVFTSDNGATPRSPQEPLRGNKGCYYEGGIREPFIIRWPGVVKSGSRSTVPVTQIDLYPTFLAAAGAAPPGQPLDGESLLPLLRGDGELSRKAVFWHFPGYLNNPVIRGRDKVFRTRPVSVIRKGDWKLHLFHEEWLLDGGREQLPGNRAVELYQMREDLGERNDLAAANPAMRDELLDDLLSWIDAITAPLPTPANPGTGAVSPPPDQPADAGTAAAPDESDPPEQPGRRAQRRAKRQQSP